jgi:hypothetical protein
MHEKVTTTTDAIGRLIDLQIELLNERPFQDLAPDEVDDYHTWQDCIRELCSELTDVHS